MRWNVKRLSDPNVDQSRKNYRKRLFHETNNQKPRVFCSFTQYYKDQEVEIDPILLNKVDLDNYNKRNNIIEISLKFDINKCITDYTEICKNFQEWYNIGVVGIKNSFSFNSENEISERINHLTQFFSQNVYNQFNIFRSKLEIIDQFYKNEKKSLKFLFESNNFKKGIYIKSNTFGSTFFLI